MSSQADTFVFRARREPTATGASRAPVWTDGDDHATFGHRLAATSGRPDDGVWSEWRWDGERLHVRNCRYGLYPLFLAQRQGEICISNRLSAVLDQCAAWVRIDEDAVATFLRLGFLLDDDTPFDRIKVFPAGSVGVWDGNGLQIESLRSKVLVTPAAPYDHHLQAYADLFASAIARRRARGRVLLPLTGGRDSRHILFELCRIGRPPDRCVTAELPPPGSNEDLVVARLLCQRFSIPHETVPQGMDYLRSATRKNELTSYCSDENTWAMPLVERINREPTALYDGIGGDVLSAGLFNTQDRVRLARDGDAEGLALDLLGDSETSWRVALTPQAQHRFGIDRAVARVAKALRRHLDAPNPVASFYFWNRTRREIALYTYGMYRSDSVVYAPYLDHDLFDYLMGLPADLMVDKQFHSRTIAKAYPEWANVRYALRDDDPGAAGWGIARRRLFHTRLAFDFCRLLLTSRSANVQAKSLILRLGNLAGHASSDGYWFSIDRIQWLLEVQRALERAPR